MNCLKFIVLLFTCSYVINCLPSGKSIQSESRNWYSKVEGFAKLFYGKIFDFLKIKNVPKQNSHLNRNICVWKICSKPLKGSMKTSIKKINSSTQYKEHKRASLVSTGIGKYEIVFRN